MIWNVGASAFGTACRQRTRRSESPLSLAISTKSLSRISTVDARMIRVVYGTTAMISVITGRSSSLGYSHGLRAGLGHDHARQDVEDRGREDHGERDPDHELRKCGEPERRHGRRLVEGAVTLACADRAEHDPDRDADRARDQHEEERVDEPLAEHLRNGEAVGERRTEIAGEDPADPLPVLRENRTCRARAGAAARRATPALRFVRESSGRRRPEAPASRRR